MALLVLCPLLYCDCRKIMKDISYDQLWNAYSRVVKSFMDAIANINISLGREKTDVRNESVSIFRTTGEWEKEIKLYQSADFHFILFLSSALPNQQLHSLLLNKIYCWTCYLFSFFDNVSPYKLFYFGDNVSPWTMKVLPAAASHTQPPPWAHSSAWPDGASPY